MSLIIATGSNIGNSLQSLSLAKESLAKHFNLIAESRIYTSPAVDYLEQPDFLNQVLEFEIPCSDSLSIFKICQSIESEMGRVKKIEKGPRNIDIDILFIGTQQFRDRSLEIPHPRLFQRSFVVLPLKELPFFQKLQLLFEFPDHFSNSATPFPIES